MRLVVIAAALVATAGALPVDGCTKIEDCRLQIIESSDGQTWLCCPPGEDETSPLCTVLFNAADLRDEDSAETVTMEYVQAHCDRSSQTPPTAADVQELPEAVRQQFGEHPAVAPVNIKRHTDNGRRLEIANMGAKPVTHWGRYHGKRKLLIIIIQSLVSVSGEKRSWPKPCTTANVRKLMWGKPTGVQFKIGASPWASSKVSTSCRTQDGACYYNARDHMLTFSRGAVELDEDTSVILELTQVTRYPDNFCDWSKAWDAIKTAVNNNGRYDWLDFQHRAVFVPSHCAAGQGSLPGTYTLNNFCPGSGRGEGYQDTLVHELGHNIGLNHARTATSEYGDGSSVMGNPGYLRTATINFAHRHMFSWMPGLPWSVPALQILPTEAKQPDFKYKLADLLYENKPAGSVWGVELREGDLSYFVSWRACTGYDYAASEPWCGSVQIQSRVYQYVSTKHEANLQTAGASHRFGTNSAVTVTLLQSAPRTSAGGASTVAVQISGRVRPRDEADVDRVDDGVKVY